jgi:hypothetical protein
MWDFVMDKIGAGAGFLRELRFPLQIYIPSASPQSSSPSPEAGTIGHEWPQCQYPHKPNTFKKKSPIQGHVKIQLEKRLSTNKLTNKELE